MYISLVMLVASSSLLVSCTPAQPWHTIFPHNKTTEMSVHPLSRSMEGSLMNIYRFTGSRCNIRIFNKTKHAPSPHMYVAGHSSPGWNRLQPGLAPPASQLASRSICIFISTRSNYSKARCERALTPAPFESSQPSSFNFVSQKNLDFFFSSLQTSFFPADSVIEVLNCCGQKINWKCYFLLQKHWLDCYLETP